MISVQQLSAEEWIVTVDSDRRTEHHVRVRDTDLRRFASGRSAEELLRESFEFLLSREPNTSILKSFDLQIITQYFPEYEQAIKSKLRARSS